MFASIPSHMSSSHDHDNQPQFLIGPDMPKGYPNAHHAQHDSSDPASLLNEARERIHDEDAKNNETVKLARRLFIAMILVALLGIVFYIVLPYYGIRLSPTVPILSFLAILAGTVLSAMEEHRDLNNTNNADWDDDSTSCNNEGCATGMCPGPRPLRMFRDQPKKDR